MDSKSQEMLEIILGKDKDTLSTEELGFVMARRGYLNDEQRKRFDKEIKLHEKGDLFKDEDSNVSLEAMSMKDLVAKAKELGVKGITKLKRSDLIKAIEGLEVDEDEDEDE